LKIKTPPLQITKKIGKALKLLCSKDQYLINHDVNERSVSHKLAEYIQNEFPNFNVDCEYNRDGASKKELHFLDFGKFGPSDVNGKTVYPDIIIHKRNTKNNLLIIEMKKNSLPDSNDVKKLKAFTKTGNGYEYQWGLFIGFFEGCPVLKWYSNGCEVVT
jgi:hypothetical protein